MSEATDGSADADAISPEELFKRLLNELAEVADRLFTGEHVPETVQELVTVVDEAEDVLQYVDAEDLAAAIDFSKLPAVVDLGSIPEAARTGKVRKAVHLRALLDAVDLTALARSVDVRQAWSEGRELDEAVDDVMGEDDLFDGGDEAPENDSGELGGLVGGNDGAADTENDAEAAGAFDGVEADDLQALRMGVQQGVMKAVDEFREGLLVAHKELAELREQNRRASEERRASQPDNRNPTAVSTMPGGAALGSRTIRGSTVPMETMYSQTPNRKRIYGPRFEEEIDE